MASPQVENGHTKIANEIIEALMRVNLSAYENRVLWCIIRKTYGFKKKTDWIALSQFAKETGLDRRLVHRAIKSLSSKQMIVIYKDDRNHVRYGFQKNYEKWKLSSIKMSVINRDDKLSSKEMTRVSSKEIPTKETITKETIQKGGNGNRPPCPHQEIIDKYHEMLPELQRVKIWNNERQKLLRARWKEDVKRQKLDYWERLFKYIRGSPFLMGENDRNWMVDLEWIIRPRNFVKIIEGKYHT